MSPLCKNELIYSNKYHIPERFSNIIQATISKNLKDLGFKDTSVTNTEFISDEGVKIQLLMLKLNSRGIYEIHANVDGEKKKMYIKPKDEDFYLAKKLDGGLLNDHELRKLLSGIFKVKK